MNNKIFVPSLGPGYDDSRVRPWNSGNTRDRKNGQYYKNFWENALSIAGSGGKNVKFISITSFNEWHEGTNGLLVKDWRFF